jgi:hypothetical protein
MAINYTILKSSIINSSIWNEDAETCKVWITMLAMRNKDGEIFASVGGLAHQARLSPQITRRSLDKFLSPDKDSASPEHEGRRIKEIPGGWLLLNHERIKAEAAVASKNAYMAEYMKRKRKREKLLKSLPSAGQIEYENALAADASEAQLDAIITKHLPPKCK